MVQSRYGMMLEKTLLSLLRIFVCSLSTLAAVFKYFISNDNCAICLNLSQRQLTPVYVITIHVNLLL